jgi:hypothetical protein
MGVSKQPSAERTDMKEELIGPTATLAAAILSKLEEQHTEFTNEVIASAFAQAHEALLLGIQRVEHSEPPRTAKVEVLKM